MLTATFNGGEPLTRLYGLTQWDYGQKLKITGLGIATDTIEVHFAQEGCRDALRTIGQVQDGDIIVDIPNILLRNGRSFTAYVYQADPSQGRTVREVSIKVQPRAKPQDYDAPDEKNLLQQMMESVQGKADGLEIEGGKIYLLSGSRRIGSGTSLPDGTGGSSIAGEIATAEEIAALFEEEEETGQE